ncbi:hypothetical protein [Cupriavidus sp. RAF12]|uniref:hypothetical protein n=1 Tax=Cupriavidus sp. RAF12 TaxID=3233050 RepID=UPI003F93F1B9
MMRKSNRGDAETDAPGIDEAADGQDGQEDGLDSVGGLDPALAGILDVLWREAQMPEGKVLSLARISKRASVQMSVLRRVLTQLADAELVVMTMEEDGRGTASLTPEGEGLCSQLFGGPDVGPEADPEMGPDQDPDANRSAGSDDLPRIH